MFSHTGGLLLPLICRAEVNSCMFIFTIIIIIIVTCTGWVCSTERCLHSEQCWAISSAPVSVRLSDFRSFCTVLSHVIWGHTGSLLQLSGGSAIRIFLPSILSSVHAIIVINIKIVHEVHKKKAKKKSKKTHKSIGSVYIQMLSQSHVIWGHICSKERCLTVSLRWEETA